jgi:hypothetical protein
MATSTVAPAPLLTGPLLLDGRSPLSLLLPACPAPTSGALHLWLRPDEAPGEDRDVVLLDTAPPAAVTRPVAGLPAHGRHEFTEHSVDACSAISHGLGPLAHALRPGVQTPHRPVAALSAAHNDSGTLALALADSAAAGLPLMAYSLTVPVACSAGGRCVGRGDVAGGAGEGGAAAPAPSPPSAIDALLRSRHPAAWRLQATSDELLTGACRWHDVDARSRVVFPSAACAACGGGGDASCALPPGVAASTLTWALPRASHCTRYRLVLRSMGGSRSSGGGAPPPSTVTTANVPLLSDPAAAGIVLTRLRLWGRRAADSEPIPGAHGWGWRLLLVGPPGQRRLRLACTSRVLDAIAAHPLLPQQQQREWAHVAVVVGVGGTGGAPTLCATISVDGVPVPLLPAAAVLSRGLPATPADAGGSGVLPTSFSAPLPLNLAASLAAAPLGDGVTVGGPAFLSAAAAATSASGAPAAGEPSLAEDAPPYPGSSLACFRGAIAQVACGAASSSSASPPSLPPSAWAGREVPPPLPPMRAGPLPSLEHVMLLMPPQSLAKSEAGVTGDGATPSAVEDCLRVDAPFLPRYRGRGGHLRGSRSSTRGSSSGTSPPSSAARGLGRLAPHGGPVTVLCHDCGPTVYADDDAVGGPRFTTAAAVEDARAASLQREAATAAAGRAESSTDAPLPVVPPSEAAPDSAITPPSSGPGGRRPPGVRVREEPLPLAVAVIVAAAAAEAGTTDGGPAGSPPTAPPPDSLLARALSSSPSPTLVGHTYRLLHWAHADVLVYFSHDRLAVPPPSWVAAGRSHGVPLLGTLITEWGHGEAANEMLTRYALAAEATGGVCPLAAALARLAAARGFHGWLVNIEAPLPGPAPLSAPSSGDASESALVDTAAAAGAGMVAFLRQLTAATHAAVPGGRGCVLWYDSLSHATGRVQWQSALSPAHNAPFLDACDGLFTDYHWDERRLRASFEGAATATGGGGGIGGTVSSPSSSPLPPRTRDVAVGVDVWGRGMPTGGQWRTRQALEMVRAACEPQPQQQLPPDGASAARSQPPAPVPPAPPLSFALFAPAWAYEACGGADGDASLATSLEGRLWSGAGDCGDGDDGGAGAPGVVNLSGTLSDDPSIALAGWSITAGGADGWAVAQSGSSGGPCFVTSHRWCEARQTAPLLHAAGPSASPHPLPPSVTVSEWHAGSGPNTADTYRLRAWLVDFAGAPLAPHDAATLEPVWPSTSPWAFDSGRLTTAAEWRRVAHTFSHLPPSTAAVVLSHGGCDAEGWAGHYGARMRGAAVTVPRSPAQADAAGLACGLRLPGRRLLPVPPGVVSSPTLLPRLPLPPADLAALVSYAPSHGVRPAAAVLPLSTVFCDGVGGGWYERGVRTVDAPWVDVGQTTLLPSFTDHHVSAGLVGVGGPCSVAAEAGVGGSSSHRLLTPLLPSTIASDGGVSGPLPTSLSTNLSHHAGWERGGCLVVAGNVPLQPHPQPACQDPQVTGWAPVRLLALDVPLQQPLAPGEDAAAAHITATLTYRVEAAVGVPATSVSASPLLLLDCGGLAVGERAAPTAPAPAGGWVTATFTFRLPAALAVAGVAAAELWLAVSCGGSSGDAPAGGASGGSARTAQVVLALGELTLE